MKIDPLVQIENMRKENEELKKQHSLVKEQIHFKNETRLDMLAKDVEMASSTISEKLCMGFQKILEEDKIMETILFSFGVQVGEQDKEFQPTIPQTLVDDIVVTQEPTVEAEQEEEKQSTSQQEHIYDDVVT